MRTVETDTGELRVSVSAPAATLRRRCVASSTPVPQHAAVARSPASGSQTASVQRARVERQFGSNVMAVILPLAVLILTPLILLAGFAALVGALGLGMSRRVRTAQPGREASPLTLVMPPTACRGPEPVGRAA